MGWLSVERKAFQDGRWPLTLERYWGSGVSLISPKLEDNQCPAAGCPRHLTDAKSGWLGRNRTHRWVLGGRPEGGNYFAQQDLLVLIFLKWSDQTYEMECLV